jgi:thiol-disulfide isomerase/thioredoxin
MSFLNKMCFVVLSCFLLYTSASYADSIAFNKEQLATLKTQNMGKQWLMLLWSVDCPPCFKELAIIQKLQRQHDDLAVVIINTDASDEIKTERKDIIEKFELSHLTNFYFVDGQGDQNRFFIDPTWYGELPRSYFVESNGTFHGKSGLVDQSTLTKWLVN